jgi:integrase
VFSKERLPVRWLNGGRAKSQHAIPFAAGTYLRRGERRPCNAHPRDAGKSYFLFKANLIRLDAADVKEKWPRRIPITYELRLVLEELRKEQIKIPNMGNYVFTRQSGKPIKNVREAWLWAKEAALENNQLSDDDVVPHDLRRSAITRWTSFGVPRDIVMAASGHKPNGVHNGYINFSDAQLIEAFSKAGLMSPPKAKSAARAKSA